MKKCFHPNIVQLKEVLDDSNSREIYLVLEYLEGGEVKWQQAGGGIMSQDEARQICRDVISGLEYLHFQGIIHRDIKPANLLKDRNGTVKISDFGVSYASSISYPNDELELAKTAGTPAFFAPELCVASCSSDDDGPPKIPQTVTSKIDIWAFGVTLYCLLFGKVPFIAVSEFDLFNVIVNEPLVFPDEVDETIEEAEEDDDQPAFPSMFYNPQVRPIVEAPRSSAKHRNPSVHPDPELDLAKDLLKHVLEKDPEKRYDIIDIKRHEWMLTGMEADERDLFLTMTREDERIVVTSEDVDKAVLGIRGRLKKKLSRALQIAGLGRKSSTSSSLASSSSVGPSRSSSIDPSHRVGPPSRQNSKDDRHRSFESSGPSTAVHSSSSLNSLNSNVSSTKGTTQWRPVYNNVKDKAAPPFVSHEGHERRRSSLGTNCFHLEDDEDYGSSAVRPLVTRRIPPSESHLNINGLLQPDPLVDHPGAFGSNPGAIMTSPRSSIYNGNRSRSRPTSTGSGLPVSPGRSGSPSRVGSPGRIGSPLRGSIFEDSVIHSEPLPMDAHKQFSLGMCDDHYKHYDGDDDGSNDDSSNDSRSTSSSESGEEFILRVGPTRRLRHMTSDSALRKDGAEPPQPLTLAATGLLARRPSRRTDSGSGSAADGSRRPSTAGPSPGQAPNAVADRRARSNSVAIGVIQNERRWSNDSSE